MKALKHIMVATLCTVALTGCDDFLTTPPLDQITEEAWWKDANQTKMMVDGCYDYVYQGDGDNIIAFRDAWTDNSTCGGSNTLPMGICVLPLVVWKTNGNIRLSPR